ncbi:MAG: ABC transporter substrate-binding protein [Oscillospiraceae bacterium]|jgi:branched-chain amino acid transport system substrate-binding protein|nr:ABC transporter substrate-binding protein [Oscillospiraceae bacterium]
MKKFLSIALALVLMAGVFAACGDKPESGGTTDPTPPASSSAAGDTIKIAIIGCHTGEYAQYGLGVKNGATLYIDQLNASGGINGKQVEIVAYDNKADNQEAINAFNRAVDQDGITALIGDVLTGNTIAVGGEAYKINMPMITASATAEAVTYDAETDTVYANIFRTCFIDPFQGEKMANYASEKLGAKTAAIIYETGNDYSVGVKDAFIATCSALGIEIVSEEGYATGDVDFKSQLTTIASKNPDVVFCPNYYEDDGLIVTQAREVGVDAVFMGADGMSGVSGYASAADAEGTLYCSGYAPGSTDAVKAFEAAYTEKYSAETLNMFAATAYDAAMVLCNALQVAEEAGLTAGTDEYKQAVIDAIRDKSGELECITSNGYTFDAHNNPVKDACIMKVVEGTETFVENY